VAAVEEDGVAMEIDGAVITISGSLDGSRVGQIGRSGTMKNK
jgi:hypothetical protein